MHADQALNKLISDYDFHTVLDVGSGRGGHGAFFRTHGKHVTGVDYVKPVHELDDFYCGDFMLWETPNKFDLVWASHVLEHQLNVNFFLTKLRSHLKEWGLLAVTVPPLKQNIVGGHVSLWNMGLLFYNLVLAGFNCEGAIGLKYGYNISVIVPNDPLNIEDLKLKFDCGDIETIAPYLPRGYRWVQSFNGDLDNVGW